ncbi:exodeoxyribonuclease VII small subunit [uncultured Bacteroides sp.]|uniref:exodeoxyribonuclease VII small subunit n=1 Tax=uncultured Bacteroides sp. TaxID=162156 RepID=UPI002AAA9C69|nr:exodeoxyribonuclease VII small subunit [uncultured Bacteroides sp.]
MAEKKESYAQAMEKLEDIVSAVEKDELDIDQLSEKLKEAQKLVRFCKDKLYKADEEIKKIMEGEDN